MMKITELNEKLKKQSTPFLFLRRGEIICTVSRSSYSGVKLNFPLFLPPAPQHAGSRAAGSWEVKLIMSIIGRRHLPYAKIPIGRF